MENTSEVKSEKKPNSKREASLGACALVGITVAAATSSFPIGLMGAVACLLVLVAIQEIVEQAIKKSKT